MAKVLLAWDDYWKDVIPVPKSIKDALGWKLGDGLIIEQPNDQSDYLIIHKVDRKETF